MKKALLMIALAMLGVMVFASMASAEHTAAHVRAGSNGDPCPDPDYPRETPDGCQASNLPDVEFGPKASPTPTSTATPAPTAPPTSTASPTASATASAASAATSQYAGPSLPDTGGVAPQLALVSLAILLVGGLLSASIVRRS